MKKQRFGTILNTASVAGLSPQIGLMTPYATTKSAVVGFTLGLRATASEYDVDVSVLCPGWVDTPMLDGSLPYGLPVPLSLQNSPPLRETLAEMGQRIYPADRLADETLAALAKHKAVIVIPGEARRMWLMARLLPGLTLRQMEQLTRATRAAAASAHRREAPAAATPG